MGRGASLILILALVLSLSLISAECGDYSYKSPVSAEANSEYSSTYSASKAIDGLASTYWFGKSTGFPKIITFDLGGEKCVNGMQINFFASDVPINFNIEISDDKTNWKNVKSNLTATEGNDFTDFDLSEVTGRYLRITETSAKRKYGTVTEIKVSSADSGSSTVVNNSNMTCTDSDWFGSGDANHLKRLETAGTCTDTTGEHADVCVSDTQLKDYTCEPLLQDPKSCGSVNYNCQAYGYLACSNGACINATSSACADSDGGSNWQIKGTCSDKTGNYSDQAGTTITNSLREYYCGPTSWSAEDQTCLWVEHACSQYGTNYVYSDGACASNKTSACKDSDGGKDSSEKGKIVDDRGAIYWDQCVAPSGTTGGYAKFNEIYYRGINQCKGSSCYLAETDCSSLDQFGDHFSLMQCKEGCVDGACVEIKNIEGKTCSELKNFVKKPFNFEFRDGLWILNWNYSGGYDDEEYYTASFSYGSDYQNSYVYIDIYESGRAGIVESQLESAIEQGICRQEKIYSYNSDGYYSSDYKVVYICKDIWSIGYDGKDISSTSKSNQVIALWTEGNTLYRIYSNTYDYDYCYDYEDCMRLEEERHRKQQDDIAEFLGKLVSNEQDYVENLYLPWSVEQIVELFLSSCGSDVEEAEEYVGSWTCKLEPAICPPHGYQNEICTRYNGNFGEEEVREAQISCNPGICSGCYVPKWFEGSPRETKCIPYGFRFEQRSGWKTDLFEAESRGVVSEADFANDEGVSLNVTSDDEAYLWVGDWSDEVYYLKEGESYKIDIAEDDYYLFGLKMTVNDIFYSETAGESYVDLTFYWTYEGNSVSTFNAYCDIDGQVKVQKTPDYQGNWAACQNNYECESNICSSGECIELADAIRKAKGFKSLFARVFCRLAHLLNEDEYDSCISGFLA